MCVYCNGLCPTSVRAPPVVFSHDIKSKCQTLNQHRRFFTVSVEQGTLNPAHRFMTPSTDDSAVLNLRLFLCSQEHRLGSPSSGERDQGGSRGNPSSPPHQVLFSHLPLHSQLQVIHFHLTL